jgi:vacuolar protein-sorting-associated protein 4
MQPVRKVLSATHFKEVSSLHCPLTSLTQNRNRANLQTTVETPEGPKNKLTPCSPGAPGAIEKTWTDVNSEELLEPLLSVRDFEKSIQINRPTVSLADIQKHIEFTNESGGEGA